MEAQTPSDFLTDVTWFSRGRQAKSRHKKGAASLSAAATISVHNVFAQFIFTFSFISFCLVKSAKVARTEPSRSDVSFPSVAVAKPCNQATDFIFLWPWRSHSFIGCQSDQKVIIPK